MNKFQDAKTTQQLGLLHSFQLNSHCVELDMGLVKHGTIPLEAGILRTILHLLGQVSRSHPLNRPEALLRS